MSSDQQDHRATLSLVKLHGLAVSLRDRADTVTERSDTLLVQIEQAFTAHIAGEAAELGELHALAASLSAELHTAHRAGARLRRGVQALGGAACALAPAPKPVAAERVLKALPTLSDAAATLRRAIPRARLVTLARELTEALGQLALITSQRPVHTDDLRALRSVFARLDGLPQALSGARERLGAALAELDEE
jgi:hypothetical protein